MNKKKIDEYKNDYSIPNYNYLKYIETPHDKNVKSDDNINTFINNTMTLPYWIKILSIGDGSTETKSYKDGKGSFNTRGALGNRYKIQTGYCKDGKPRWTWVDNVPNGKIPIIDPLNSEKIIEVPSLLKGLVPGLLQDLGTINPVDIYRSVSGEGNILGECFVDYKNMHNTYFLFSIFFVIALILFFIYKKK